MIARFLSMHKVEQTWLFKSDEDEQVELNVTTHSNGDRWNYKVRAVGDPYTTLLLSDECVYATADDALHAGLSDAHEWREMALQKKHLESLMAKVGQ